MFDPQKLFRHFPWPAADLWALGLVGFASLAASLKFALRRITERPANAGLLLGVGLLMLGLPAAIVSASEKYQEQVRWGLGYLPVYLQYFGLAIVAATVACSICAFAARRRARRFHDCFAVTSAVGFSAAAILSFFANRYVVELRNAQLRYPRDFIESAARHGFFKDVPAESIVLKDRLAPWDTDVFYLQHSGRKLHVMTPERWLSRERDTVFGRKPSQGVYALDYESDEREDGPGWAVLGRLSEVYFQKNGKSASIVSRMVEDPQAYVEAPATLARRPSPLLTNGWRFLSGDAMAPAVFDLRAALRIGDRWANTQLPRGGYRDFTGPRRMPAPASACGLLLQEPKAPDASVVPVLTARAFTGKENIPLEQVAGVLFDGDVVDGQTVRLPSGNSSRVSLSAAGLGQSSLGLALYVYPTGGQPRYAAIVSNHGNWRGFGLEQDGGTNPAQFQLTIGNGNSWKPLGPVSIPPGEWSLILLGVEPSRTTLRVIRGETDIRRELDSAPAASLSDSDLVYLGNWPAGDRPFIGRIGHVSVADHPFDASQTEAIVSEFHRWTREAPQ
jgi:hypothetical protein